MFRRDKKGKNCSLATLIGAGTLVDGNLTYSGGIHIDGTVLGDLAPENPDQTSQVWIGEKGIVKGSVRGTDVIVHGSVDGDIFANQSVTIGAKARVAGDVCYSELSVDGCSSVTGRFIPNRLLEDTVGELETDRNANKSVKRYQDMVQMLRRPRG
jgi:cytoskeletal protein CcmA (bactofilin family)